MEASNNCLEKIKEFEGLRLQAYQCSAGVWTIGYGHTLNVRQGDRITEMQAEQFLLEDVGKVEGYIDELHLDGLTQGQYDALVDFVFNLGIGNLTNSTLLQKIRAKAPTKDIQAEFKRWVYAGGKKWQGLIKRRDWEAKMWNS